MLRASSFALALFVAGCGSASTDSTVRIAPPEGSGHAGPGQSRRVADCSEATVARKIEALRGERKKLDGANEGKKPPPGDWDDLRQEYRSLLAACPETKGMSDAYYAYVGVLYDAEANNEAAVVMRSLVCHNHYAAPVPERAQHLPQDRPADAWQKAIASGEKLQGYVDPYPADCQPLETLSPGYHASTWYFLGEHHADGRGDGGPFEPNRALTAFDHAIAKSGDSREDVIRTLRLTTHFKAAKVAYRTGRYALSARHASAVLDMIDQRIVTSVEPTVRAEVLRGLTSSILAPAFDGPAMSVASLPVVDPTDDAMSPADLERLYEPGLARLQDDKVLRQDSLYAGEVALGFAAEVEEHNLFDLANRARDVYIAARPTWGDVPRVHADAIHALTASASMQKASSPAKSAEASKKAKERLAALKKLTKQGAWFDFQKSNAAIMKEAAIQVERAEADVARRTPKKLPDSASNITIH